MREAFSIAWRAVISTCCAGRSPIAARSSLICVVTFLSTFGLYHLVGRDWIPADDQSELQSSFTLPEGTSLAKTTEMATDMASEIVAMPEVSFVQSYTHGPTNHAHLFIGLVPRSQRKFTHQQMATRVRGILGGYRNVTYNVRLPSVLGGEIYFPITAVIRGPDLNQLAEISKKVADRMRKYPDLVDVIPSLNLNTPELQVKVDRQRAADIGVRMTDISDAVRLFYSGEDEITRFKEGSEQYPVTMQLLQEQRDNPDVLDRMMVPSSKLGQVRLESVATIGRGFGPGHACGDTTANFRSASCQRGIRISARSGRSAHRSVDQRNRIAARIFVSVSPDR